MRYIRYAVLAFLAIVMVTVAVANRGPLTLRLLPEELSGLFGYSWEITLPVFVVLLLAVLFGVVLGFVWEWIREHRHRAEAVTERRAREKLEKELGPKRSPEAGGDDVLALLESR
ncbi:MAG: DUF1049 domain-containing protein [Boseongicola sp.]|nr:MAG: DUF1049 domain-containing protein [Boseongicola sp.]